ncbi:MAG: bifunctional riboflavin kinase/FAD synthetase [Marinosulfonomonas sp.]|nr:bifunctional riboflavin kinase/FAD synthetase [Marinosulfonomonas sp.]
MRSFQSWNDLNDEDRGACAAIGNFDGVHIGHQAVIEIARKHARQNNAPLGIVTFEPHPRQVFAPTAPPFRLMNAEARANRLEKMEIERLYQLPFNAELAGLTAAEFVQQVLVDGLGLSTLVVGQDFKFGKGRTGTAQSLVSLGKKAGITVIIAELVQGEHGAVSSTAIRQLLADGHPARAAQMLGHLHRIDGEVFDGEKRGRELGYPTANMSIKGLHPPKFGVYAVKVDVLTGRHKGSYGGAASVGVRPMFGDNQPNLETFIFDFSGDLYGEHISIAFVDYLRAEAKFDTLDQLVKQIDLDCEQAREILAKI